LYALRSRLWFGGVWAAVGRATLPRSEQWIGGTVARVVGGRAVVSRGVRRAWPVLAAVAAVSCAGSGATFDSPEHDVTRDYLRTVADGGSPAAFYGVCGGKDVRDAHALLAGEGAGFKVSLKNSTRIDDLATVNVSITGQDGSPSPYSVDLNRENGKWLVCRLVTGNVAINVDF
jgi:hypothetical protein